MIGSPTRERAQCLTLKASARRSGCTPVGERRRRREGRDGEKEGGRRMVRRRREGEGERKGGL